MESTKNTWYELLTIQCHTLAEKLGLDDLGAEELKSFINRIAKDQYKAGNKSGIRWAFKQKEQETAAAR